MAPKINGFRETVTILKLPEQHTHIPSRRDTITAYAGPHCHFSGPFQDASFDIINPLCHYGERVHFNHNRHLFFHAVESWSFHYSRAQSDGEADTFAIEAPRYIRGKQSIHILAGGAGFYSVFVPQDFAYTLKNESQRHHLYCFAFGDAMYLGPVDEGDASKEERLKKEQWERPCNIYKALDVHAFESAKMETATKVVEDARRLQTTHAQARGAQAHRSSNQSKVQVDTSSFRTNYVPFDKSSDGIAGIRFMPIALDFKSFFASLMWHIMPCGSILERTKVFDNHAVLLLIVAIDPFKLRVEKTYQQYSPGFWQFRIPRNLPYWLQSLRPVEHNQPNEDLCCLEIAEIDLPQPKLSYPSKARQMLTKMQHVYAAARKRSADAVSEMRNI